MSYHITERTITIVVEPRTRGVSIPYYVPQETRSIPQLGCTNLFWPRYEGSQFDHWFFVDSWAKLDRDLPRTLNNVSFYKDTAIY